jgi:GMP synthase-like glutamine amidotransferase
MKPIRFFRHLSCESPDYFGSLLERRCIPYDVMCLDAGVAVPRDLDAVAGLVFMGGPGNVADPTEWMRQELDLIRLAAQRGTPVLGICLGAQLISEALGGRVIPGKSLEVGWHNVEWFTQLESAQRWFGALPPIFEVFQWHEHTWTLPPGAVSLARSSCAEQQAFSIGNMLAVQFHLEITAASIRNIVEKYPGDLATVSDCVQSAAHLTANLDERTRRLYQVADVLFGRWLDAVYLL